MKRIFLRLYLALFLSLAAIAIGLDYLYALTRDEHDSEEIAMLQLWRSAGQHSAPTAIAIPSNNLSANGIIKDTKVVQAQANTGSWLSINELYWPPAWVEKLRTQQAMVLEDPSGKRYFYGLDTQQQKVFVLRLGSPPGNEHHWFWLLLFYGTIALVVYLWLQPLVRDIDQLQRAVNAVNLPDDDISLSLRQRSALTPVANAFRVLHTRSSDLMALQRDIANAVSHDIRTPLSRIRFAMEVLSSADDDQLKRSIQNDLREIEQLTEEMLQYAQFEHHTRLLQWESLALHDFVDELLARYQHQTSIQFENTIAPDIQVSLDRHSFQRALQNLIDNALRYARQRVRISWQLSGEDNHLVIEDDGPGIAQYQQTIAAEAFVQLNVEQDAGGYGLGLAIVKKICLWHGGAMQLDRSVDLGGARITLRWPNKH